MNEISDGITARHAQIKTLQADIDALQRAVSVLRGQTTAKTTPTRQPTTSPAQSKAKRGPHQWSAAEKAAIGKRMKAYWATRKKPSAPAAASPAQPTATQKRKRAPMSAAAK